MATIMIRCPKTGESVSTGIGMDFETFKQTTMTGNKLVCPSCGELHQWEQADAFPDE